MIADHHQAAEQAEDTEAAAAAGSPPGGLHHQLAGARGRPGRDGHEDRQYDRTEDRAEPAPPLTE